MTRLFHLHRRCRKVFIAVLLSAWSALSAGAGAQDARTSLLVAINGAPPYRIVVREGNSTLFGGLYVEIIREAADRAGLSLRFEEVPFIRGLKMMETGQADLMLGPNKTEDRAEYMDYLNVTLPREPKVFYLRPGIGDINSYESIIGKQIGVLPGAVYFPEFDADNTVRRVLVPSYASGLEMTQRGRIDAVIMPELLGAYLMRIKDIRLTKSSYTNPGRPSYVVFSKKSPLLALKDTLERALESMHADGTMDRIIARYR